MNLETYVKILNTDNESDRLKILGYDPAVVKVGEIEGILKKKFNIDFNYIHDKDYIKVEGRKFYLLPDLEEMSFNDYSIYKSMIGYIYSDGFDEITDEVVLVSDEEKMKRLFNNLSKVLSMVTYEKKNYFRKPLTNDQKVYLYNKVDVNILFFFIQLFLRRKRKSVRNIKIYSLMKNKLEMEEPIQ
jgi:hypothetical protein